MPKKSRFREPFHKYHGKRAETLFKAEPLRLYHIYWSLWRQFRLKKSLWVICKILALFINPLTADDKYSVLNRDNLLQHFHKKLCKKWKILSEFFKKFSKLRYNFDILFLLEKVYRKILRCNYLRNKKYFLNFFLLLHFVNLDSILKNFKKRMTLIADVFLNLRTRKKVVW